MKQKWEGLQENVIKKLETCNLPTVTTLVCRDKDGNILSEKKKILEKWQKYFKELLNSETERINNNKNIRGSNTYLRTREANTWKINEIIKIMRPNKAAGPDEILPDFLKKKLKSHIKTENTSINNVDMETKKKSCELSGGMLCPLHKKGDRKQCNNYRGLSLLNII